MQETPKAEVTGSNPVGCANHLKEIDNYCDVLERYMSGLCPDNPFFDRSLTPSHICETLNQTKTPTTAATVTGANNSSSFGAHEEQYLTGLDQATTFDIDSDTPQAVTAYVSRSTIYVIDQNLNVVAYGALTRREVLA